MASSDETLVLPEEPDRPNLKESADDSVTAYVGPAETVDLPSGFENVETRIQLDSRTDPPAPDWLAGFLNPTNSPNRSLIANRYELCEEIGQGGMGVIHAGWDTQLKREVAIKILLDRLRGNPCLVDRFLGEARITGRLQHAGIVSIHELGWLSDGRPFFVMKRVHGETLQQLLAGRTQPDADLEQLYFIFGKVCEAVAYAHTHGIIHRDLKPANIMVGEFGAVSVMDWGLGKILGEQDVLESLMIAEPNDFSAAAVSARHPSNPRLMKTEIGTIFGTPAYFSPEQARGEINRIDQRADVFALGSILCEILTGKPPYNGENLSEVLAKAVEADVSDALERLDASSAPLDLLTLAKNCLSPTPSQRPASAVEVATAVMDYLQSEQRRAERDLVRFFDLSVDLFGIADLHGRFERVNEKFTQVLGYSTEELTSRPFLDFVHPEDRQDTLDQVRRMALGEPAIQFLNRYLHANGHYLWLEWNARQVPEERAIYAVARDVTDRVALADAHRRAEESRLHLAEVVNSAEVAIISANLDGIIQSWNPEATDIFGYSAEDAIGQSLDVLNPPETDEHSIQQIIELAEGGKPTSQETKRRRKDGSLIPVSLTISPVRDSEGRVIGISKIARDISQRKRQEALLSEAEEKSRRLAAIVESASDAIISTDLFGRIQSWNQAAQRLFGYNFAEVSDQYIDTFTSSGSAEEALTRFQRIRQGEAVDHFETVGLCKDGRKVDLSLAISPIYDRDAKVIGASHAARDITQTKQMESELLQSQSRKAAILDSALDCIITINHEGRILDFNPAAERTFGYQKKDVINRQLGDVIVPPSLREAHERGLKRYLATGTGSVVGKRIELPALRSDGTEFPVELAISVIKTESHPIFTASLRDITERKRIAQQNATRLAVSNILAESHTIEEAIPRILEAICEQLDWSLAQVFVTDRDRDVLRFLQAWNAPRFPMSDFIELSRSMEFTIGFGLAGRVWASRTPVWITAFGPEETFPRVQAANRCGIRSASAFPIIVEDQVSGIIEVLSHRTRPEEADMLGLLSDLGNQIGQFVERKRAEEDLRSSKQAVDLANMELRERVQLLALGQEIGSVLAYKSNLQEMLQKSVQAIVNHLDCAFARIWTLSTSGETLELQASAGQYTHLDGAHSRIPLGQFKIGQIARDQTPHLTNQVIGDPSVGNQEWAEREGMVAFAGYPLLLEGRLKGVVALFARHTLSETTLGALGSIAEMIAASISRKQTEDALLRSAHETLAANQAALKERRSAEEANQNLAAIVESSADAIIGSDLDGTIRSWNSGAIILFGYSRNEAVGQPMKRLFAPEYSQLLEDIHKRVRQGERIQQFETVQIHKDGHRIDVSLSFSPIRDPAGDAIGTALVARDITERKSAEAKLAQSQRELLDFAENANVPLHRVDRNGIIIWANQAELDYLGYQWHEYVGHPIAQFHADPPVIEDILNRLITGQTLTAYKARLIAKDGSIKTVSIYSSVYRENGEFKHTRCFTTEDSTS